MLPSMRFSLAVLDSACLLSGFAETSWRTCTFLVVLSTAESRRYNYQIMRRWNGVKRGNRSNLGTTLEPHGGQFHTRSVGQIHHF